MYGTSLVECSFPVSMILLVAVTWRELTFAIPITDPVTYLRKYWRDQHRNFTRNVDIWNMQQKATSKSIEAAGHRV